LPTYLKGDDKAEEVRATAKNDHPSSEDVK
jgi:hypothetical protein